ncbi:sulfotransferase family protein [Nocardioides seonyuensis]|uniref:sulfotransferase family protein n=1 Tax=Nocardioides seonyuensis TaxID=2518371 RepID=UPI001FC92E85|nr:sulfotransferase family protein [Nocardioides seonyuensis]
MTEQAPSEKPHAQARAIDEINPDGVPRKVLFVAGAGRSGTSTLAGIVSRLGMHVPLPEVPPDDSNPRGFSEPQWVVDVHDEWLAEALVQVSDSRPSAWFDTGRICSREPARIRVSEWLEPHFDVHPELVVKDPRLSWFLGLWRVAAIRTGATPVFATMLRPPAEVVGSKQKYYANKLGSAHLAASWVNMLLHTERATRPTEGAGSRVFVRYEDLLTDWVKTTMALGHALDLQTIVHTRSDQIREVHRFIDPNLRRVNQTLADLGLPTRLHELTAETWEQLTRLADPDQGADSAEIHETFDQLRAAYTDLYEEAEAISRSTEVHARLQGKRQLLAELEDDTHGRRFADMVPHEVRAAIPPSVRRGVRKALGRERADGQ